MSSPEKDEVERLRSLLRHAHDPRKSFTKTIMRGIKSRLGARIQKKAIVDRVEKPAEKSNEDAA